MKEQIAQIETVIKAIAAEDKKRPATQPPNPLLADATTRGRTMIVALNRYAAEQEVAAKAAAAAPEPPAAPKK